MIKVFSYIKYLVILVLTTFLCNNFLFAKFSEDKVSELSSYIKHLELRYYYLLDYKELIITKEEFYDRQLKIAQRELSLIIFSIYKFNKLPLQASLVDKSTKDDLLISYSIFLYYLRLLKVNIKNVKEQYTLLQENKHNLALLERELLVIKKKFSHNISLLQQENLTNNNVEDNLSSRESSSENIKNIERSIDKLVNNNFTNTQISRDKNFKKMAQGHIIRPVHGVINRSLNKADKVLYKNGVSFVVSNNSAVVSPFKGEIVYIDKGVYGYNNIIIIKHSPSYYSVLTGNFVPLVHLTKQVEKKEIIAKTLNNVSLLYFEMRNKDHPFDIEGWLEKN